MPRSKSSLCVCVCIRDPRSFGPHAIALLYLSRSMLQQRGPSMDRSSFVLSRHSEIGTNTRASLTRRLKAPPKRFIHMPSPTANGFSVVLQCLYVRLIQRDRSAVYPLALPLIVNRCELDVGRILVLVPWSDTSCQTPFTILFLDQSLNVDFAPKAAWRTYMPASILRSAVVLRRSVSYVPRTFPVTCKVRLVGHWYTKLYKDGRKPRHISSEKVCQCSPNA